MYLGLAGAANLIWGITALSNREYFAEGGLVWSNLDTWGWISVVIAAVQLITALLLAMRWFGGVLVAIIVAVVRRAGELPDVRRLSVVVERRDRLQRPRAVGRHDPRRGVHAGVTREALGEQAVAQGAV